MIARKDILLSIAAFTFAALFLCIVGTAHADNPIELPATITSAGNVSFTCPVGGSIIGFGQFNAAYPGGSDIIGNPGVNQNCPVVSSGIYTLENGYQNGLIPTPDGIYWMRLTFNGTPYTSPDWSGDWYYVRATRSGGVWSLLSPANTSTSTRIDTVTPANGAFESTSTTFTFAATGFVTDADYVDGTKVTIQYSNGGFSSTQLVGPAAAFLQQDDSSGSFTFPVTGSGTFSFSTTTSMQQIGNYTLQVSITRPRYSIFGFSFFTTTLVSSSTAFLVSTSTPFGSLRAAVRDEINAFQGGNTSVCNPISGNFSIVPCVAVLFVPDPTIISRQLEIVRDDVLERAPWGYPTRLAVIFSGNATTALPSFTVNVPLSSTTNTSLTFDPGDMLAGGATLLDDIDATGYPGQNLRSITEPMIKIFLAITILIIIWHDIMAMGHRRKPQ